ncbi:MAG: hypothetical protein IPI50_10865 [Saprospiraceae bacterium]|nr:hypothetical protein [Saprospiraceae bacterium]
MSMQSSKIKLAVTFYIFLLIGTIYTLNAQFQSSFILGLDIYQQYRNPSPTGQLKSGQSSGSVVSGVPIGLQFGYSSKNVGIALEISANLAPLALDIQEYKGLGAVSIPLLLKGNFGALTGLSPDKLIGYSIGVGVQFNRTELFGLHKSFQYLERSFFPTLISEAAIGGGIGGFCLYFFARIGVGESQSMSLNFGINTKTSLYKNKQLSQKPNYQS